MLFQRLGYRTNGKHCHYVSLYIQFSSAAQTRAVQYGGGHVGAASPPHHGVVQHLVWDRVNANVHPNSNIELK